MLPLSATGRQIHYLPPPSTSGEGAGVNTRGIVLPGSYRGYSERMQLKPPVQIPQRDHCSADVGHTMPYRCLHIVAVGFWVDEEQDLGGWVAYDTQDTNAPRRVEKFRDGRLVFPRMESFNVQDDVDLAGICFVSKGPINKYD
ncbi:hypothetical protein Daus18300_014353 [Diaporthe australafricana]|uniref:Uncharacterized protein n=1 Tax=Diaporthe australafricana TaxID=127596 RepID=A0ABR3VVN1_9PEZI